MSSSDEGHDEDASGSQRQADKEPLACVTCRARKLKCDRSKPACARCIKVHSQCVYPESRRKPTFKRRNVRELEERLAQVETLLKGVSDAAAKEAPAEKPVPASDAPPPTRAPQPAAFESEQGWDYAIPSHGTARTVSDGRTPSSQAAYTDYLGGDGNAGQAGPAGQTGTNDWQMMDLGLSEAPPPWEVIEELTDNYFNVNHYFVPIVHPGKYRQAMYGGPYMQPPMCLQYIIWAVSAHHHEKYSSYSDVFYRRSRLYFEKDEMRGDGEFFVTLAHAQTLTLLASYEAKRMLFTRAAMNTAKCVRLINMMGLEKIDGDEEATMGPVLQPCKSWADKEERRRVFWGAYAIDAHASVSTGWPSLINTTEIRTRLPSSEAAFASGKEETAPFIEEIFDGAEYSTFASTLVSCHVFKTILNHSHRPKHSNDPEDVVKGAFWERHREFDNMLTSLLMFLPAHMRLHNGNKEPAAIYLNMNLHAAIICLHHSAIEKVEKHDLSLSLKQASLARMRSSAMEIANIAKVAANMTQVFKSPLCSLSLYTATTVYVYLGKQDPVAGLGAIERSNLEQILRLMDAIGRVHEVTNAFLQQAWNDLDRNGLGHIVRNWNARAHSCTPPRENLSSIPLITRTNNVHRSQDLGSILPGKLPIDKPKRKLEWTTTRSYHEQLRMRSGAYDKMSLLMDGECFQAVLGAVTRNIGTLHEQSIGISHKRKRMSHSPGPDPVMDFSGQESFLQPNILMPANAGREVPFSLPDRTGSSSSSSPAYRGSGAETQLSSGSSGTSPGMLGLGNTAEENRIDLRQFQGRVMTPQWDPSEFMFGEVTDEMVNEALGAANGEPWSFLTADMQWPTQGEQPR